MTTIAIIGSAGRKDDAQHMSPELYRRMYAATRLRMYQWKPTRLISGGAAWADHLAVQLYLQRHAQALKLVLPAYFKDCKYLSTGYRSPGGISNYYHKLMSDVVGYNTLSDIQAAIDQGAEIEVIPGFKARNTPVAHDADYMLAMTFGTSSGYYTQGTPGYVQPATAGLKLGGTADTWFKCRNARAKYHKNLHELL